MQTEAERNIGFVIRILQYIGWPFSILFVPVALISTPVGIYIAATDQKAPFGGVLFATFFMMFIAAFFVTHILVAKRMKKRDPSARLPGIILSVLMLLGFPLFTIVGVLCLSKISANYDTYCREV